MKKILLFCSILLLLTKCRDDGLSRSFHFYNNSGKPVCYYIPLFNSLYYPDTVLPIKKPELYEINKQLHFSFGEGNLHEDALFAKLPADTLSIYFFDPDTLAKYDWSVIRQEYKILVRYDLSHADLKKLEWRFYYPPTEAMKNMKMYPEYNQLKTDASNIFVPK